MGKMFAEWMNATNPMAILPSFLLAAPQFRPDDNCAWWLWKSHGNPVPLCGDWYGRGGGGGCVTQF